MIAQDRISLDKLAPVRLILAWMIVFYHTYRYLGVPHAALSWIAWLGPLATDLFFIISGISLAHLFTDRIRSGEISFRQFFIRRLSKLYPLLLIVLPHVILSWVLLMRGTVLDGNMQALTAWEKTLACLYPYALLDAWKLGYTPGIAPTWVISAFAFCYLVFFFFVKYVSVWIRKRIWWWVAVFSGLTVLLSVLGMEYREVPSMGQVMHTFPPVRLILFLLGVSWVWAVNAIAPGLWTLMQKSRTGRLCRAVCTVLALSGLYWIGQVIWPVLSEPTTVWRLFFASFTALLVVLWATGSMKAGTPKMIRAFRRWTNYSLPLFILHIPLSVWYFRFWQALRIHGRSDFQGIRPLLSEMKQAGYYEQDAAWKYGVFLLVCWVISALAYRFVIQPFSEWVRERC